MVADCDTSFNVENIQSQEVKGLNKDHVWKNQHLLRA